MTNPTSRIAYTQFFSVFDQALASPKGVRLAFTRRAEATFYVARLHAARDIDRRTNKEIYEPGHPLHGCSGYDILICRQPRLADDGKWWVYVERNDHIKPFIEDIPEVDDLPLAIEVRPQLRIEVVKTEPTPALVRRNLGGPTE